MQKALDCLPVPSAAPVTQFCLCSPSCRCRNEVNRRWHSNTGERVSSKKYPVHLITQLWASRHLLGHTAPPMWPKQFLA